MSASPHLANNRPKFVSAGAIVSGGVGPIVGARKDSSESAGSNGGVRNK